MTAFGSPEEREEFLNLLESIGAGGLADHPERQQFIEGSTDIGVDELYIDSLVLMEIGILLEGRFGVSLSPNSIAKFRTVGEIWGSTRSRA